MFKNGLITLLIALCSLLFAGQASAQADPLANGDVWKSTGKSWPGTIEFDSASGRVTLAPLGAATMNAKYVYTLSKQAKPIAGTLVMTLDSGEQSKAKFNIDGRQLTLAFDNSPPETYQRITHQEAREFVGKQGKASKR